MIRSAVIVVALAACGTPTPQLRIALAGPPSQACPSTECEQVPLLCDAVMSIRIVDPKDPGVAFYSQCTKISINKDKTMCSLRSVNLDAPALPVRDLEVQIALYPLSQVDFDPATDEYSCPGPVKFSSAAPGFPIEQSPSPALGGNAYYHPGDEDVTVTLGCTELEAINEDPTCVAPELTAVTATVDDFASQASVTGGPQGIAEQLRVSVGEPHLLDGVYVLNPPDQHDLRLLRDSSTPTWTGDVDVAFEKYVCVEVLQDSPETTGVLQCTSAPMDPAPLELHGIRISRGELQGILAAIGEESFPEQGLTIGIVLDAVYNGAPGVVVKASEGTIKYMTGGNMLGGAQTSESGIFVSTDAPFGTMFSSTEPGRPSAVGGLVAGKITIVILRPAAPAGS